MSTAREVISDALTAATVLAKDESLHPADAALGLRWLQRMMDSWSNDNLMIYATGEATKLLAVGTASYALSGFTPSTRPVTIANAWLDSVPDVPLIDMTEEEYDSIPDKTLQGIPLRYFYKPTATSGTVYLFPVPNQADTLHINGRYPLASGLTLDSVLSFPPGYEDAIVLNLAVKLAPLFDVQVSGDLRMQASSARDALITTNYVPGLMQLNLPRRDQYNIESDI